MVALLRHLAPKEIEMTELNLGVPNVFNMLGEIENVIAETPSTVTTPIF